MYTCKIYEDEQDNVTAAVFEDGKCCNYIPSLDIVLLEGNGIIEDAKAGFPEACLYEYDVLVGLTMEKAAARDEKENVLIAEIGEEAVIYPNRMSEYTQEIFKLDLGEDVWNKILEQTSGEKNEAARLNLD